MSQKERDELRRLADEVDRLTRELKSSHDYLTEDGCGDRTTRDVIRGMRDALLLCRYCGGGDHVYANCPVLAADKGEREVRGEQERT